MTGATGRPVFCPIDRLSGNNAYLSDNASPAELQKSPGKLVARGQAATLAMLMLVICACKPLTDDDTGHSADESGGDGGCGDAGSFRVRLYGEITADLQWTHAEYECRGMPRPDGDGVRLFFAGPYQGETRRLAFILAIPDFRQEAVGQELATTLTLMEEGSGRFFSTAGSANCLTELGAVDAVGTSGDRFVVTGAVYCISPLAEVNGDSSVSIAELRFTGLLDRGAS